MSDHGNYWPKDMTMPVVLPQPTSVQAMLSEMSYKLDEIMFLIKELIKSDDP